MKCEECRERLWAYLEGESDAAEAAEIEGHLAACGECREELSLRREIMETLRSLPDAELPAGYHTELMEKLRAAAGAEIVPFPQKKKAPKWKQLSLIAAAVLIVVAAGGVQGMQKMRQSQNEINQQMEMAADAVTESAPAEAFMDTEGAAGQPEAGEHQAAAGDLTADSGNAKKKSTAAEQPQPQIAAPQTASGSAGVLENKAAKTADAKQEPIKADMAADTAEAEETAAEPPAEDAAIAPYSMTRAAAPMAAAEALDAVTLTAEDPAAALEGIRGEIAAAEGYEEFSAAENVIFARIPKENYGDFCQAMEGLGELDWTKTGTPTNEDIYHSVEITVVQE